MSAIVITGANRGLGYQIVARLLRSKVEATIFLGSRSLKNGQEAISQLKESGLDVTNVEPLQIDVASSSSIEAAAALVKEKYDGKILTVYNNAGIAGFNGAKVTHADIMNVNYYGVKKMVEAFNPMLVKGGHNVIVSSGVGAWGTYFCAPEIKEYLTTPEKLTEKGIDDLVERYTKAIESGDPELLKDFPDPKTMIETYAMSKAFVNAWARLTAPEQLEKYGVITSLVCPGHCATDLNNNNGARKAATGARSIVMASTVPPEQTGQFFRDGNPISFAEAPRSFEDMAKQTAEFENHLREIGDYYE